jgi:glycosyltransferase involved in cell wall biosynthesis
MVKIIRGTGLPNAITKVGDELLKNLSVPHNVEYTNKSVYGNWLSRYNDNIIHSMHIMYTPLFNPNILTTVYDMHPLIFPKIINSILKLQYKIAYSNLKKAKIIVTICEYTKNDMVRLLGINPEKIKVIYCGVDHTKYNGNIKREEAVKMLGLDPNYRYITCVSNISDNKNLQLLNKIENLLPDDVRIIKAGYGTLWQGTKIINMGRLSEEQMPLIYRASLMSLHPSLYEGFGLAILEACACNVPIVAYDNTTQKEITKNGLVHTENEFIERTLYLLDNPQTNTIGKFDSYRFSWQKMAKEYEKLYEEMKYDI